jgi:hypothetical protein
MKRLKMNKRDRTELFKYVRVLANRLSLKDWVLICNRVPCDPGSYAEVMTTYGKQEAVISFRRDFRKLPAEQVRESVVHELLHCHLQSVDHYLTKVLPDMVPRRASRAVRWEIHQRNEEAVNDIARSIAAAFPLIKWPK